MENQKEFEKNYKFPLINLIPAIVWSIPVYQQSQPVIGTVGAYGLVAGFLILFITLSYLPIAALVPGIASVIMLTALFWAPADHIGNNVARIVVKALILIMMGMIELCVLINATLPWLESKTATPPRVRRVDE